MMYIQSIKHKKRKGVVTPYATILIKAKKPEELENAKKEEVIEKDLHFGLFVLGTEKHESRRIDNQLRGRSGRQ